MTKYVYVVYQIDEEGKDLDMLQIFENPTDARRYAEMFENKPRIWQRPLKDMETFHKEYIQFLEEGGRTYGHYQKIKYNKYNT